MATVNGNLKKRKKERIKINSIYDFKLALENEGYIIKDFSEENFKVYIMEKLKLTEKTYERLNKYMDDKISFKVDDINDFITYIQEIILFEEEHMMLFEKFKNIDILRIDREEYERIITKADNVENERKAIEKIKDKVSYALNDDEYNHLEVLEKELDESYVYAKDIELLKKIIMWNNKVIEEKYDEKRNIKTLYIKIPSKLDYSYIPAALGTVEYHHHIRNNIPRINRLIRNIDKYIEKECNEEKVYRINHSKALQDSINLAIAKFQGKEFKAISGKNNIDGYCCSPIMEDSAFESCKVNKLGKIGVGYRRINDSEKKILEEINKKIQLKQLKDEGELILYSKWQPCPSCYYVISQFCSKYPKIKVSVKYRKSYGE